MAYIRLDVSETIYNGQTITFKAPCACNAANGIKVYYPTSVDDAISTASKTFTFKDAHGNDLTGLSSLFNAGAYVEVALDVSNGHAYILNADTNGYIEKRLKVRTVTLNSASWSASAPYTQVVSIADITAEDRPMISVGTPSTHNATNYKSLRKAYAMIDRAVTGNGTITFYCYSKKPTVNIPIIVKGA